MKPILLFLFACFVGYSPPALAHAQLVTNDFAIFIADAAVPAVGMPGGPIVLPAASVAVPSMPGAMPTDPSTMEPATLVADIFGAAHGHHWRILIALLIVGLVYVDRKFGLSSHVPWFKTDRGGIVLSLLASILVALAALLFSPATLSAQLVTSTLLTWAEASGAFVLIKRAFWPAATGKPIVTGLPGAALLLIGLGLGLACAGCATDKYIAAYQTVTAERLATTESVVGLEQYDQPHQMALSEAAKTTCHAQPQADAAALIACQQATGGKALDAWDGVYKKIKLARDSIRTLFDTAEVGIASAQAAQAGTVSLTAIMLPVKQALRDLAATLNDAGVPPGYAAALLTIAGDK